MAEGEKQPSLLANIGMAVILVAILVVAVYGFAHASIRPINPAQKAPKGHFAMSCGACHSISEKAPLVK